MEEKEQTNELSNIQPDNPISRAIAANKDGTITSVKCQICNSKFRNEIEELFDKGQPVSAIKRFVDEKKDTTEVYALWRFNHHFSEHYKNMQQQAAMIEYRDRLDEVMKRRRNMVDDIEHSTGMAWMALAVIAATSAKTLDDLDKQARIMALHQKTILSNHEFIKSLHDEETVRRASEERFGKVWMLKLEQAKTEEEKKLILSTLQDFKEKLLQMGGA